jgi:outer membrane protein assembly factor BamB
MYRSLNMNTRSVFCLLVVFALCVFAAAGAYAETGGDIVAQTGIAGGIVVHLGCGDGALTVALRANDSFTVHGLDSSAKDVAKARERIHKLGLYGSVSVEQFDGSVLPYADNLVNLMIVQDAGSVPMDEVMRVLVPGGVAYVKKFFSCTTIVKERPDNIDDWSHFLHDAGNNAVAKDTVVGPPKRLQWVAPPLWLRSHETPSGVQAQVSAGGRLFYIFDEGLIGIMDDRIPDRWSIICRDAFNGKLLWKKSLEEWGWREWSREKWEGKDRTTLRSGRTDVPEENGRRLVADSDRIYVTLSYRAPLSILDAATGEVLSTVSETGPVSEIIVSDRIAVVHSKVDEVEPASQRRGETGSGRSSVVAVDGATGKVLWRQEENGVETMSLAINEGRVIYRTGGALVSRGLNSGSELWRNTTDGGKAGTLVATDGYIFTRSGTGVSSYDGATGKLLWSKANVAGGYSSDLFVADGLVWGGVAAVSDQFEPIKKGDSVLAIGLDPRTGEEKKRVAVASLRSPEHHHRCYRNKATDRYIVTGLEGAEFVDLQADNHSQNNWIRGACKLGIMPCNGLLYVPSDQCFCQPGSKLLGFAAIAPESAWAGAEISDAKRLEKGPAYGKVSSSGSAAADWPTFRHDAARTGATGATVSSRVATAWKTTIGGKLTAPVAAEGKVFVACADKHTVYAFDMKSGSFEWKYTAGGRVDSPPTIYEGHVLFGSKDGRVYCLRASDGELAWRFMAAPRERRIGYFGQIESAWPVHGSVLVNDGIAYFTAGRSTYLEGGIRVYGLDPATGRVLHEGLLEGPDPNETGERDVGFYIMGANSDVLVAENGRIYMRQKAMTPDLKEIDIDVLSVKGERDVGLHVFSTSSLLDDSWYDRAFWMYSKRWPSFQLANQAPKTGQLLVVGEENTYALRVFYRRNVHTPMFFPGKEGYLLFADKNTNEPQIVGEEGSRKPIEWLPQSDYVFRPPNVRTLDSEAFGQDKLMGYTRVEPALWMQWLPVRVRAMVKASDTLFVAGAPDELDATDPYAAFEGRRGARLVALSTKDGSRLTEMELGTPPVFDGMIAAGDRLFVVLEDGSLVCLGDASVARN